MSSQHSAPEAERAIIGALFLEPSRTLNLMAQRGFTEDWLTDSTCRIVFDSAMKLVNAGQKIDPIIVSSMLPSDLKARIAANLHIEITSWMDSSGGGAYALHYLNIVRDRYERRRISDALNEYQERLKGNDKTADIVSEARHKLNELVESASKPNDSKAELEAAELEFEQARACGFSGVPSRWIALQELTGGYPKGKVTLIAARPSQGKSTFVNNEAIALALKNVPVAIASMEMNSREWLINSICDQIGIDASLFRNGRYTNDQLLAYRKMKAIVEKAPIYVHEGTQTLASLCSFIRDMAIDKKCELIAFDYIQLIKSDAKHRTRNEEVSAWSNTLANLAKELPNTALIGVSQLNRAGVMEKMKRPELHNLRDSGSLEQDAYRILLIYQNPAVADEVLPDNAPTVIEVAKNRGGRTGQIMMTFEKSKQRFVPQ